jgi:signal transduction histidine kinase
MLRRTGAVTMIASVAAGVVVTTVLACLAWRADLERPGATTTGAALDVGVGVALAVTALLVLARPARAALLASTGATWLLGSILPVGTLHQAPLVLAIGLGAFATGPSVVGAAVLAAAAACAWGGGGQLVSAALLVGVAVVAATGPGPGRARLLPAVAGAVLGAVLLVSWALRRFAWSELDQQVLLLAYELALLTAAALLVAVDHPVAGPASRVRQVLGGPVPPSGLRPEDLVEDLLRRTLRDPGLALVLGEEDRAPFGGHAHVVRSETGQEVARILSDSPLLQDDRVVGAIDDAVRLVAASMRLRQAQEAQVAELERSRARLVRAVDLERAAVVATLRDDPLRRLDGVIAALEPLAALPHVSDDVGTAIEQLAQARADVSRVVEVAAPADLGGGAVREAVRRLPGAGPLTVDLTVGEEVAASPAVETAIFYVCAEALVNAARHSGADLVRVDLAVVNGSVVLVVEDDGRGGADITGSGIRGLGDRVAACGGAFSITSPAGGGTRVVARFPVVSPRSAPTA